MAVEFNANKSKEYINNNTKLEILLKNNIYELQRSEYVFKYIFRSDNYSLNRVKILNKSDYEYIKEKSSDYEIGKELLPIFFIGPIIGCALAFVYSVTFFKGSLVEDRNFIIKCDLIVFMLFLIIQVGFFNICKYKYSRLILESER